MSTPAEFLHQHLRNFLAHHIQPRTHVLLGLSGGQDSVVLLHCLLAMRQHISFELSAMHVHHGLNPKAGAWAEFCKTLCQNTDVPCQVSKVTVDRSDPAGIEAAARTARYHAFSTVPHDVLLLAHHQQDQAETVLLQLLRGAGSKGLSAMAMADGKRAIFRPFLNIPKARIEAYANQQQLDWVEDESNQDLRYARNFVRHKVLPVLASHFPAVSATLARSASLQAEQTMLADTLAEMDAANFVQGNRLLLVALEKFSDVRARNLLRWWIASNGIAMPSHARLGEMMRQLTTARADSALRLVLDGERGLIIRRFQDAAWLVREPPLTAENVEDWTASLAWHEMQSQVLPDGSSLLLRHVHGQGIAMAKLAGLRLEIRYRRGGERLKCAANRPSQSLQHCFQEKQIPPWLRPQWPLVYCENQLICVPGVGIVPEFMAEESAPGLLIEWLKD